MLYCKICWIKFANNHETVSHYKSNIHRDALQFQQSQNGFNCSLCSKNMTGQAVLDIHLKSDRHRSRVEVKALVLNRSVLCREITADEALEGHGHMAMGLARSSTDSQIARKSIKSGLGETELSASFNSLLGLFLDEKMKKKRMSPNNNPFPMSNEKESGSEEELVEKTLVKQELVDEGDGKGVFKPLNVSMHNSKVEFYKYTGKFGKSKIIGDENTSDSQHLDDIANLKNAFQNCYNEIALLKQ